MIRPDDMAFAGLENYGKLFHDENFWKSLKNTVCFTVIVVPVQCALALGLALLVSAIPMTVMFIFMQKYYVEGIASSGIKG